MWMALVGISRKQVKNKLNRKRGTVVILITTRMDFIHYRDSSLCKDYPLWFAENVLDKNEEIELIERGIRISVFNYEIDPSDEEMIEGALDTIKEHHPGEEIEVYRGPDI